VHPLDFIRTGSPLLANCPQFHHLTQRAAELSLSLLEHDAQAVLSDR